jgi:hypothetical protein
MTRQASQAAGPTFGVSPWAAPMVVAAIAAAAGTAAGVGGTAQRGAGRG